MIENITDENQIISIWRPFTKELGIPYRDYIKECIDNDAFFCYKVDGHVAGIVCYYEYKRKKEIAVESLIVLPEYRGQHIATKLINHVYKENESLIKTLGYAFVTEAQDGLPNNNVYNHLSTHMDQHKSRSGSMTLNKYYLDTNYFDNYEGTSN